LSSAIVMVTCVREGCKWRVQKERMYSRGKSGGRQTRQRAQAAPAAWSKNQEEDRNAGERDRPVWRKYSVQAVLKPLLESTIPFVRGL
jgi:hypothetical protein